MIGESKPSTADACVIDECDVDFELEQPSPWARVNEVPWKEAIASRPLWALTAAHSAANFYNYFALAWLPTYFRRRSTSTTPPPPTQHPHSLGSQCARPRPPRSYTFGLSTAESSAASLLPFVAGAVGGLSAGVLCDTIVNQTGISLTSTAWGVEPTRRIGCTSGGRQTLHITRLDRLA